MLTFVINTLLLSCCSFLFFHLVYEFSTRRLRKQTSFNMLNVYKLHARKKISSCKRANSTKLNVIFVIFPFCVSVFVHFTRASLFVSASWNFPQILNFIVPPGEGRCSLCFVLVTLSNITYAEYVAESMFRAWIL